MEEADKAWFVTMIGMSGCMFLLVLAYLGVSESRKMIVHCVCVRVHVRVVVTLPIKW